MASFNRVILVGNLTRDPELRYIPSGTAVSDIGLAVNDRVKKGDQWVDETTFVDITLWGRTAEIANEYLSKGSPVLIEGRLKLDRWEKDGQKHSKLKVTGDKLQMLGSQGRCRWRRRRWWRCPRKWRSAVVAATNRSTTNPITRPPAVPRRTTTSPSNIRKRNIQHLTSNIHVAMKTKHRKLRHKLTTPFKPLTKGERGGIELLLVHSVEHVGKQGQVVEVKKGYAYNYLIPQGLATHASDHHKRMVDKHKVKLQQIEVARQAELRKQAAELAKQSITIEANATEDGHLYGSVGAAEIVAALKSQRRPLVGRPDPPRRPAQGTRPVHGQGSLLERSRRRAQGVGRADRGDRSKLTYQRGRRGRVGDREVRRQSVACSDSLSPSLPALPVFFNRRIDLWPR